eukprot:gene6474-6702_t
MGIAGSKDETGKVILGNLPPGFLDAKGRELRDKLDVCLEKNMWFFSVGGLLLTVPVCIKYKTERPFFVAAITCPVADMYYGTLRCARENDAFREHYKSNILLADLPVIMMSANEQKDTVFQAIAGGAEEYLVKPVTKKEVQNIWQYVWKRWSASQLPRPSSQARSTAAAAGLLAGIVRPSKLLLHSKGRVTLAKSATAAAGDDVQEAAMYQSPEEAAGAAASLHSSTAAGHSVSYSLGMLFLDLLYVPPAGGSRMRVLADARRRVLPADMVQKHPAEAHLIMFSRLAVRGTVRAAADVLGGGSAMVCSAAFDRDDEYIATAGVSKRIRIFEYAAITSSVCGGSGGCAAGTAAANGMGGYSHCHAGGGGAGGGAGAGGSTAAAGGGGVAAGCDGIVYPVLELSSRSRLSCVVWSSYVKAQVASSDYDGVVQLWDANTGGELMQFEEHAKRAWAVDFSRLEPTRLVSSSDDGTIKLWSIHQDTSVATLQLHANVCSVQFSPDNSHLLAAGCANYRLYMYDLRKTGQPLSCVPAHRKAVSYVRWLTGDQLVSASTDSTVKLWNDWGDGAHGSDKQFVSCVAWNKRAGTIVAANSAGHVKVLELV